MNTNDRARPLTPDERAVLRAVVVAGAPQDEPLRAALLTQLETARATGPSCECGCASLGLEVDRATLPPVPIEEVSADAADGRESVGFRVTLADGYLDDVKFYGYGDAKDTTWPPASAVRQVPPRTGTTTGR